MQGFPHRCSGQTQLYSEFPVVDPALRLQFQTDDIVFDDKIEDALKYANSIELGGEIVRPYFGVGTLDVTDEYNLWKNRITLPDGIENGVVVVEVVEDSPAEKAKIEKGDVIVKIGDEEISGLAEFRYELYQYEVGDKIKVTFNRGGKEKTVTVTLGKSE